MKKLLLLAIITISAISFTSCKQAETPKEKVEVEVVNGDFKLEDTAFDGTYTVVYNGEVEEEKFEKISEEIKKMIDEEMEKNPSFIREQNLTADEFFEYSGRQFDADVDLTDIDLYRIEIDFNIDMNADFATLKKSFGIADDLDIFDGEYIIFVMGSEYGMDKDKIMKDLTEIVESEIKKDPSIKENISIMMADFLEKTGNVYETEEDINKFKLEFGVKRELFQNEGVKKLVELKKAQTEKIRKDRQN